MHVDSQEDVFDCSICLERYTDPRLLGCSHSFCLECLLKLERRSHVIKCPECREHIKVRHNCTLPSRRESKMVTVWLPDFGVDYES